MPVDPDESWRALAQRDPLALLIDLDGTLLPFAATPEDAVLDESGATLLRDLVAARTHVVVVSGRPRALVEPLLERIPGAWFVAEHGAWRGDARGWDGPPPAGELDPLEAALGRLAARHAGALIERKSRSITLHHRLVAPARVDALLAAADELIDEWLGDHDAYGRLQGAMVLEVRHKSAHKGTAVAWVRERLGSESRIVALGDDFTDEDMFAPLGPEDAGVFVEHDEQRPATSASWRVSGVAGARALLGWIVMARAGDATAPPVVAMPRRIASEIRAELLVISNRSQAPTGVGRRREVGGLVAALEPALRERRAAWLGWSGQERDPGRALTVRDDGAMVHASFAYPPGWGERFYGGFCNRSLWPLFHFFLGRVRYVGAEWDAYREANDAYAELALEIAERDATVWVHDYHLLLVGEALRRRGHRGPIGHFLHVPFPPSDVFGTMPWGAELLAAMLRFDLIGFHTERWAHNFRECAQTLLGAAVDGTVVRHEGRRAAVEVFPIGIDPGPLAYGGTPSTAEDIVQLREIYGERKLVLGVDRLDYSKGIPQRLEAFERLLERYPRWRRQVHFVQVSVPSRESVPEYAELRGRVESLVGHINGTYGEADWIPVRYLYRSYPPATLAELYRAADVGLVTPLRDGMNLVAKEFVASQDPDDPGVLVLSRFAGAADELGEAMLTNPYHVDGVAADLDRALEMAKAERVARHRRLLGPVLEGTSMRWADRFLARLAELGAAS
jgi:trehalose 6-phosphate synthase